MKNRLKILLATISLLVPALVPVAASAEFSPLEATCNEAANKDSEICKELNDAGDEDPISGQDGVIVRVTNIITFAAGAIATIIIMISGITMIFSSGDPAKIKTSRDSIIYTVVGVIVVLLARTIVLFVINRLG